MHDDKLEIHLFERAQKIANPSPSLVSQELLVKQLLICEMEQSLNGEKQLTFFSTRVSGQTQYTSFIMLPLHQLEGLDCGWYTDQGFLNYVSVAILFHSFQSPQSFKVHQQVIERKSLLDFPLLPFDGIATQASPECNT